MVHDRAPRDFGYFVRHSAISSALQLLWDGRAPVIAPYVPVRDLLTSRRALKREHGRLECEHWNFGSELASPWTCGSIAPPARADYSFAQGASCLALARRSGDNAFVDRVTVIRDATRRRRPRRRPVAGKVERVARYVTEHRVAGYPGRYVAP